MIRKIANFAALAVLVALTPLSPAFAADGGAVSGTVLDGKRQPVSGMAVRATDVVDPSRSYTATTDSDGRFALDGVPAGSYLVSAETVNTSWIQKDDSPIVEVSQSSAPSVSLVLIKTTELSPSAVGGDGHGIDGVHLATLGFATLGTVGAVVAIIQHNNDEEDHDQLVQAQQRLEALIRQLQGDVNNLGRLEGLIRQLQGDVNSLKDLEELINELQRDLNNLGRLVDQRIPASPRR